MKTKYFNIDKSTTDEDLKKQFRDLSKKYHPDKVGGSESDFTNMTQEYENILKSRSMRSIDGIQQRIREELQEFYTKIAPELTEYKPEFLQLYDDLYSIFEKTLERGIKNLSQRLKISAPAANIARMYLKKRAKIEGEKYRKKIQDL